MIEHIEKLPTKLDQLTLGDVRSLDNRDVRVVKAWTDYYVPTESSERRALGGGAIATIGGLGLLVIFMLQNTDDVPVQVLVWDFTWPVWLLILASAVFGAFVWLGLGVLRRHRRRKERRQDRRD